MRGRACVQYAKWEHVVDGGRHETLVEARAAATCTQQANINNCATDMCEMVGATEVCTQCNQGKVPIDGTCTAVDDTSKTKCKKDATTDLESNAQVCGACAPGYFKNPTAVSAAVPPCIACNDTTGNNNNKGIDKCSTCTIESSPNTGQTAKCTKCIASNYLKVTSSTTECVATADACGDGYAAKKDDTNGNRCLACTDQSNGGAANCAECSYDSANTRLKCTKCDGDKYLKTTADGATTCVTDCGDGYFQHTATGGLKTCQSCSGRNAGLTPAAAGVTGCAVCTYASNKVMCTKCEAGKYLKTTSDSTFCVTASACRSGFFPKADDKAGNRRVPCGEASSGGINNCAECSLLPYK